MSSEVAPNLFIVGWLKPGSCYLLDLDRLGVGEGKGLAMSEADWENALTPVQREQLMDWLTRESAEEGIERLVEMLNA